MAFKNIIFDIDGTILDSYYSYMDATKKAIKEVINYEITDKEEDDFFHFTNKQMHEALGCSNEEFDEINKISDKYIKESKVELFPNIEYVIKELKNNDYFLGINTSRTREETLEQDCLVRILKFFDFIVTSDMVQKPKPDKESTILILESNKLNKNETIMIGDSVNDALTSNHADITFALASWGARDKSVACNIYLEKIEDILKIIKKS